MPRVPARQATGILIDRLGMDGFGASNSLATITNNGGTIWAGTSTNGGKTIHRGTAIDTVNAPNPVLIELKGANGDGRIFGDINISPDDAIEVTQGKTWFSGVVNGDANSNALVGSLEIANNGKFVLCQEGWTGNCGPGGWENTNWNPQDGVDGPSVVHVDTFTMTRGGTIGYQLTPKSGTGDYPQVFANTANLRGTLNPQFLAGFYANQTMYNDIVVAGTRNGTFDAVEDNSILLETQALYDGNTVDLKVTRTPFNKVAGLTRNQKAAGGGIEKVYSKLPGPGVDPSSTTPFAQLVANLFTVGSAGDYGQVLDQLAGSQYAQVLQSMLWSTRALNGAITDRMDCNMNVTNGMNVGPAVRTVKRGAQAVASRQNNCRPGAEFGAAGTTMTVTKTLQLLMRTNSESGAALITP